MKKKRKINQSIKQNLKRYCVKKMFIFFVQIRRLEILLFRQRFDNFGNCSILPFLRKYLILDIELSFGDSIEKTGYGNK